MMKDCYSKSLNFSSQVDASMPDASDIGDISDIIGE